MPYKNGWRMYYLSGQKLIRFSDTEYKAYYDIRSAISADGVQWNPENKVHIPIDTEISNIAAPHILNIAENKYLMTFSYVKNDEGYQLGAAVSENLNDWTDCSDIFMNVKFEEWDRTRAYPCSFIHNDQFYIVYGGDNFGKQGMGLLHVDLNSLLAHI
jgi:hypothetical protein